MSTFKSALAICGLSQSQAADYFDVSLQTVKHWSSQRNAPPEGVWKMLSALYSQIEDAADFAAGKIELGEVDPRQWPNISADVGADPLPGGAADAAGAMALLIVIRESC